ncbi:pentatricopeptide repeat-containing protein [Senna tora]|uniref:Protein unc-45 homolog B n=1 Tax=Senna tora TaxID=362788 RepID=A0A834TYY1_9FABA|nr:pentatricopeptide repeat-containing protein [Senna tora]
MLVVEWGYCAISIDILLTFLKVLRRDIPWETYMSTKLISGTSLQLLRRYDHKSQSQRAQLLDDDGPAYVRVFVHVLRDIHKEETVEYVLALIDEMLTANPKRARLFHDKSLEDEDAYEPFLKKDILPMTEVALERKLVHTREKFARPKSQHNIVANGGASNSKKTFTTIDDVLKELVKWLCEQLRNPSHPSRGVPTAINCLATLLKEPVVRSSFVQVGGVKLLVPLISPASTQQSIQLLYETCLCIWLLSYYEPAIEYLATSRALPRLIDVVKTSTKEKVVRVVVLTLKNLLSKGTLGAQMVDLQLPQVVQSLKAQAWSDEDLLEALNYLEEGLKDNIKKLSSFDKYKQEVLLGNLDWSPMHKDPIFWRENITNFEENDFQILRVLITILDTSGDPRTLAVACFDLSQFVQHHPAGRIIVTDLKAKERVMKLMNHENAEVTKNALLCIQRLFLGAKPSFCNINVTVRLTQQARSYGREPFPTKISHYLYRAKLIDSIRLNLRSNPPNSLHRLLNDRLLDSFVVTQALRSAPSATSALSLVDALDKIPSFSHTQNTLHALATVLAKSRRSAQLKSLITDITAGRFGNVRITHMNLLQWYAAAGDLESVLEVWDEYKLANTRACTESYNIIMALYAQMGKDSEAVKIFHRMIDEGVIPNCRTYTIIIEHLVNSGKSFAAMEVFNILPLIRIKRTLKQYSILIESFIGIKRFDEVKTLLNEMQIDGTLPSRAMCFSLQQIQEEGFLKDTDKFFKESLSDERIKKLGYSVDSSDDDENEDESTSHACEYENGIHLKPWMDPRALASALQNWGPDEVSALEAANFVWTTRLVCKILRNFKSPEIAWNFFCWVAYQPGFTHDIYTVQRTMTLLARHGRTELVDRLISKIKMEGMRLPFSTIRLIIDFYGISKNADAALKVFKADRTLCGPISKFNLMLLYSSILRALTKCGRNSDALDILDEMILNGIFPDIQTFSGLMQHFAHLGDIKRVQKLFVMVRQSGLEPDAYLFKVLIQGYCKSGRAALAWRIFEDMKNSGLIPDSATKELLVKSLWKEGRRREAAAVEESCEEINEVLPLTLRGHIWSVSSADLTRVYNIYSDSFLLTDG